MQKTIHKKIQKGDVWIVEKRGLSNRWKNKEFIKLKEWENEGLRQVRDLTRGLRQVRDLTWRLGLK